VRMVRLPGEFVKDAVPRSPRIPRQARYPGRPFAALFDVCRRKVRDARRPAGRRIRRRWGVAPAAPWSPVDAPGVSKRKAARFLQTRRSSTDYWLILYKKGRRDPQ